MNLLFVCNQGKNRSRTAAELFKGRYKTRSSGLFASRPLSEKALTWADLVVVMEDAQRAEIGKRFPATYLKKKIISLDIPDIFQYNQSELIDLLQDQKGAILAAVGKPEP
ncbi:MAG: phosphotyrosine protein phosphatase [Nanoarchaeota archaeon]